MSQRPSKATSEPMTSQEEEFKNQFPVPWKTDYAYYHVKITSLTSLDEAEAQLRKGVEAAPRFRLMAPRDVQLQHHREVRVEQETLLWGFRNFYTFFLYKEDDAVVISALGLPTGGTTRCSSMESRKKNVKNPVFAWGAINRGLKFILDKSKLEYTTVSNFKKGARPLSREELFDGTA